MTTATETRAEVPIPRATAKWIGLVASALPIAGLLLSATMKLAQPPQVVEMFVGKFGYAASSLRPLGGLEIACALLFAIPRTSVLGAILVTGYLGGAIATHVRIGQPFVTPLVLGILVWIGLYLREPRLRALAPYRT